MKKKGQYTMLNAKQQEYVDHAKKMFGKSTLSVAELKKANSKFGCKYAPQWLIKIKITKLVNLYLNYQLRVMSLKTKHLIKKLKKY